MKASVLQGKRDITLEDIPMPDAELEGVVIKVRVCGTCGSDLHLYRNGVPDAMELITTGKVDTNILITHEFPLSEIKQAFDTKEIFRAPLRYW